MMRQIQLLFTALFLLVATGLNAQFNITATTTPEFCAGTGTASFTVNNTIPGATVDFMLYKLPDTTTPYRTASEDATATTTSQPKVTFRKEITGYRQCIICWVFLPILLRTILVSATILLRLLLKT